jgi:hypothetical protein
MKIAMFDISKAPADQTKMTPDYIVNGMRVTRNR